jgi:tetratricopeptide (TPR) repeat protein
MNTKSKIKDFFDSKQDNIQYIDKYEENLDFFNDLLRNGHKEDIEFVIPIKMYKYADSLNQTGKYKKALDVLLEIENDLDKLKGQSKWYNQYIEGVTFFKGVCLGRLKKYADSNKEFEKLLRKTSDNDNFIHWYKSNKKNQISNIMNKITIIGVIIYLIILFADFMGHKVNNLIIREFGLAIALLSFAMSYIWRKMIDRQTIKIEK